MTETPEVTVPDEAYGLGEAALRGYSLADCDMLDAASEVIDAAAPSITSTADRAARIDELRTMAGELAALAEGMRVEDDRTIRSSALGEGVQRLRARADELEAGR